MSHPGKLPGVLLPSTTCPQAYLLLLLRARLQVLVVSGGRLPSPFLVVSWEQRYLGSQNLSDR